MIRVAGATVSLCQSRLFVSFHHPGTDGFCKPCAELAEAHDSCHAFSGVSFSTDAQGTISTSFSATVDAAPSGCCQANSCIGTYFESQVAQGLSGDRVYFEYQVTPPASPAPRRAAPRPAPPRPTPNIP